MPKSNSTIDISSDTEFYTDSDFDTNSLEFYRPLRSIPELWAELPIKTLQKIFKNFGIKEQLKYMQVCTAWATIIRELLQELTELTLWIGRDTQDVYLHRRFNTSFYGPAHVQLRHGGHSSRCKCFRRFTLHCKADAFKTTQFTSDLMRIFPQVTSLQLVLREEIGFHFRQNLWGMLQVWGPKLITLKVHVGRYPNPYVNPQIVHINTKGGTVRLEHKYPTSKSSRAVSLHAFIAFLNASREELRSLRHLTLDFQERLSIYLVEGYPKLERIRLRLLSQLESFHYYTKDVDLSVYESLTHYGAINRRLSELKLATPMDTRQMGLFNLKKYHQFANIIKHLSFRFDVEQFEQHIDDRFTQTFQWLTTLELEIDFKGATVAEFSKQLASLEPLEELTNLSLTPLNVRTSRSWGHKYKAGSPTAPQHFCPILSSVQSLTFTCTTSAHTDVHQYYLDWLFPDLEVLYLVVNNTCCTGCRYYFDSPKSTGKKRSKKSKKKQKRYRRRFSKKCVKQMVAPLCTRYNSLVLEYLQVTTLRPDKKVWGREFFPIGRCNNNDAFDGDDQSKSFRYSSSNLGI